MGDSWRVLASGVAVVALLACGCSSATDPADGGSSADAHDDADPADAGRPDDSGSALGCPPLPAFPDIHCTGWEHTGVALEPYDGPTRITVDGTILDGLDITTCLEIAANDVVIRRSRIACPGGLESETTYGVSVDDGVAGLVVEDTEIRSTDVPDDCTVGDPPLLTRPMNLYGSEGARLTRVYFHNVRTGIGTGSNTLIEDSVLLTDCNPDPHGGSGEDWQHSTAINSLGGASNVVIRHCVIDNGAENASSAMSFYPQNGPNDSFTIEGNRIDARSYYCAYFGYTPPDESPNTRFTIVDNVWGTQYARDCGESAPVVYSNLDEDLFGRPYPDGWGSTWSGNTWHDGEPYELSDL